jgi:hypothetical protein
MVAEQLDPDEIVDILHLSSSDLVDVFKERIIRSEEYFTPLLDEPTPVYDISDYDPEDEEEEV